VVDKIINLINERLYSMENFDFEMPKELRVRDVVEGEVVQIEDNTIYLDVKQFTEAVMHLDHFTNDKNVTSFKGLVKIGYKIKCQVTKITEEHIFVSRLNQLSEENYKAVIEASSTGKRVKVTVKKDVNKGFMVDYNGNQVFMPASLAGADTKVGDKFEVIILPSEDENKKPIASRKAVLDIEYKEAKEKELAAVNVDDVVEANVAKVEKYGAFLRFGMVQGLLRAKDYSHKFVDIQKEIKVGDTLKVKVIKKDENNKIEFSRKALIDTPYQAFVKEHKVSDKIVGKVVEKTGFGLILEIAPDLRGLLHKSEYSHNPNDNLASVLKIGDTVEVAIIGLTDAKEKVSLSRKALMDNPWERVDAKVGDVVDVKVTEVTESGLKVEAIGVDGFVPASEAVLEKKNDLSAYYQPGDCAKAIITDINPKEWRLKLSIKKHQENESRKDFEKYLNEDESVNSNLGEMFKDVLDK
jgi:small subunit ribosomal protein S1